MKKMILMASAAVLLAMPAVQAQKVNKAALLEKIEKCDADVANPKKGAKAATWIARGQAYAEAEMTPTKNLFAPMEASLLKMTAGEPKSTGQAEVNGQKYNKLVYPYFTAYAKDGKITAWEVTQQVKPGALDVAIESYAKAYELDEKQASKVKAGLEAIVNYASIQGNVALELGQNRQAAEAYLTAYRAQQVPAYGESDPSFLYNAGYLYTVEGPNDAEAYALGAKYLEDALAAGYTNEDGNLYYYLFHCYYGQKAKDPAMLVKAKDILLEGIGKYPKNELILDGLMTLYTTEDGVGDPADLIAMIDKALKEDPKSVDLWYGRGRIYYKLENYDETIASFKKVVELKPDLFEGNFYLGLFYTVKADALNQEMNAKNYRVQSEYDADLKAVNAVYMEAIPHFEKAHKIKPEDIDTVDYLKQLCFRLRDEPGMMDKYNTYNEMLKKMRGEA